MAEKITIDKKYNALDRLGKWDEETRLVIERRLRDETGDKRVFSRLNKKEMQMLESLVDLLLYSQPKKYGIKVAETIAKDLVNKKSGVRYNEYPWRYVFYKEGFKVLARNPGIILAKKIVGIINGQDNVFLRDFIRQVLVDAVEVFYSHPIS